MTSQPRRERVLPGETLAVDLGTVSLSGANGVVWGLDSPQLNANLVTLDSAGQIEEHHNGEVDVLLLVVSGQGEVVVDGTMHPLGPESVVLIPRGANRSIRSIDCLVYFSVHARRPGLRITEK